MNTSPGLSAIARRYADGEIDIVEFDRLRAELNPLAAVLTSANQHSVVNPGTARDIVTGEQVNAQGAYQVILAQTGANGRNRGDRRRAGADDRRRA